MKRLAPLVVMFLFAVVVPVSAQEFTRATTEEVLQLQKAIYSLQARVVALESAMTAVQTQLAAPPATVGFKQVAPGEYIFDAVGPGHGTITLRAGTINLTDATTITMRTGPGTSFIETPNNLTIRTGATANVEGGSMYVKASSTMDIRGALLKLNGGSRPALPLGASITCPAGQAGGPATVVATQTSVLIP